MQMIDRLLWVVYCRSAAVKAAVHHERSTFVSLESYIGRWRVDEPTAATADKRQATSRERMAVEL
jgi:hypothetical protein